MDELGPIECLLARLFAKLEGGGEFSEEKGKRQTDDVLRLRRHKDNRTIRNARGLNLGADPQSTS